MRPSAEPSSTLVRRFVADVLERTIDTLDDEAYQRAVQEFVEELRPWMPPVAAPVACTPVCHAGTR